MNDGLTVRLEPLPARKTLASLWHQLDARDGGSFFTTWPWIGTWLSVLPPRIEPKLLRIERGRETLGAAIAVYRRVRRHRVVAVRQLHLNATGDERLDGLTIEHNGFAGCDPSTPEPWRALVDWLRSGVEVEEMCIGGVGGEAALPAPRQQTIVRRSVPVPAYRVDLTRLATGDGLLETALSANSRQQLRRAMRAFKAHGPLAIEEARTPETALRFFDGLKALHVRSWTRRARPHAFANPFFERFHRALIGHGASQADVQLLRVTAGTFLIGFLYNFRRGGCVYAYQSGLEDSDARLRPGYVAHALAIEHNYAAGEKVYDFMAGANRLKQSFATERYMMEWHVFQRSLLRFQAEELARGARDAFRSAVSRLRQLNLR
ncbi:MAG TPA: GNAT family N-acetyltransferase [Alphaproteobacteria bacterium]|nr:GNAT family N-acetyltransferase [Alphaproteobacteria bacterium]